MKWILMRVAVGTLVLAGCGGGDEDGHQHSSGDGGLPLPMVDCAATSVPTYTELSAVLVKCTVCHDSARTGAARVEAPVGVDFDTYAAAMAHARDAAAQVHAGTMPPAPFDPLPEEEKAQLYQWALCGTPQ